MAKRRDYIDAPDSEAAALDACNGIGADGGGLPVQIRTLVEEVLPGSHIEHLESPAAGLASCAIADPLPIRVWVRTARNALVEIVVTIASISR